MAKIDPTCEVLDKHDDEPCLRVRHCESGKEFHVKSDVDTVRELDAGSFVKLPNGFAYDMADKGHCFTVRLAPGEKPAVASSMKPGPAKGK
jgi:hypothetical protein